ncbi:MAG: ribonuclease HII [Pseudomonadota bacterium]
MDALSALLQEKIKPEKILYERGYAHVAGVDEAGRGPLAGPVIASAVVLPQTWHHPDIKDSKKLTAVKRERLFYAIQEHALAWNWALVEPPEIDRINILQASLLAMKKAIETLGMTPDYILIDGPHAISSFIPQTPIIKGDIKSFTISAASIMSKVVRDSIMKKYHRMYPLYNFLRNKGYGTKEHLEALRIYGHCPIHRKTFKRVAPAEKN